MSVQSPAQPRQPLLPSALARSLNDLAIRIAGGALVTFAAISWLALISWQMRDNRAGDAAARGARNLLGAFGSNLSDMMVQTLGIAVMFALICPMVWGMELLSSVRWIPRFRLKLAAFTFALVAMAGFASGLPAVPGWPLPGGAGGTLGDLVYNLAHMTLPRGGSAKTDAVVLATLGLGGTLLLLKALGVNVLGLVRDAARSALRQRTQSATTAAQPIIPPAPVLPETELPLPADPIASRPAAPDDENAEDEEDATLKARAFAARFAPGIATGKTASPKLLMPAVKALSPRRGAAGFRKPSLNLLQRGSNGNDGDLVDVQNGARMLHEVLAAFGVIGQVREARPGPVVTRYEFEPQRGTKLSRVTGLADDFARELGTSSVRVSVIPGQTTIGFEVPNELRSMVLLRDVLESDTFAADHMQLPLALGKGIGGEPVAIDLARMPHLLVAGTTGSGKSVGLHAMLLSLLYKHTPAELRLLLIDPKMLELSPYDRIPHLLNPVITDPQEAAQALEWAVEEMERRYQRMARHGVRNIDSFNARIRSAAETGLPITRTVQTGYDTAGKPIWEHETLEDAAMPFIVIVIDELADLMVTAGRRVETSVQRLAQKARAAGIHLVMATQRPSVDVVTGTIKANLPVRISYRVASKIDSRTILGDQGAEQLLGNGDLLLATGAGQMLRVHGAYVSDEEIGLVAGALRAQGDPHFVEILSAAAAPSKVPSGSGKVVAVKAAREAADAARAEETYLAAVAVVAGDRKVSPGHLHRRLGIGEDAAGALIDRMEREGLVGAVNMIGRRAIHIPSPRPTTNARPRVA